MDIASKRRFSTWPQFAALFVRLIYKTNEWYQINIASFAGIWTIVWFTRFILARFLSLSCSRLCLFSSAHFRRLDYLGFQDVKQQLFDISSTWHLRQQHQAHKSVHKSNEGFQCTLTYARFRALGNNSPLKSLGSNLFAGLSELLKLFVFSYLFRLYFNYITMHSTEVLADVSSQALRLVRFTAFPNWFTCLHWWDIDWFLWLTRCRICRDLQGNRLSRVADFAFLPLTALLALFVLSGISMSMCLTPSKDARFQWANITHWSHVHWAGCSASFVWLWKFSLIIPLKCRQSEWSPTTSFRQCLQIRLHLLESFQPCLFWFFLSLSWQLISYAICSKITPSFSHWFDSFFLGMPRATRSRICQNLSFQAIQQRFLSCTNYIDPITWFLAFFTLPASLLIFFTSLY